MYMYSLHKVTEAITFNQCVIEVPICSPIMPLVAYNNMVALCVQYEMKLFSCVCSVQAHICPSVLH